MSAELSPHIPDAEPIGMSPSYRVLKRTVDRDPGGWIVSTVQCKPVCAVNQTPAPTSHVKRFRRSYRNETKSRLENLLQKPEGEKQYRTLRGDS